MNSFVLEVCEKNGYGKTTKKLRKKFGKFGSLQRLENFMLYKKETSKKKSIWRTSKLSFEVNGFIIQSYINNIFLDKYRRERYKSTYCKSR